MRGEANLLAIVGGTILDGNGGVPLEDGVILIEDGRIAVVGDKLTAVPPQAIKIAATDKYIIPGLMDANVHLVADHVPLTLVRYEGRYDELAIEAAQVALRSGVTTVFDSWGPREYLIKARDAINEGRVCASRIYLAGNIVGFGGPFSKDFFPQGKDALFEEFTDRTNAIWQEHVGPELMAMSPEQVRQEIRRHAHSGIDFLKYAVNGHGSVEILFSPRVQQVIVDEAHRAGITVQTHQMSAEGLHLAIEAGVDLMQHCEITLEHPLPAETVTLLAERRVPGAFLANTQAALDWYREKAATDPYFKRFDIADLNERALLRAGAVILLSTDGGVFSSDTLNSSFWKKYMPPRERLLELGEGHFNWLLAVEQKGMKPMDALLSATRNIARAYNVDKDLGTLEKGKIADLVVLDRNPLESATHYRSVSLVIKEGRIVDRDSLPTHRLLM
jgi:imidazolonepropionase-like amidohydrolase